MITKSKNPKYSYLRRISGLVLMFAAVLVLSLSIQNAEAQQQQQKQETKKETPALQTTENEPEVKKKTLNIKKVNGTTDTTKKKYTTLTIRQSKNVNDTTAKGANFLGRPFEAENQPLYILDGKEISAAEMKDFSPNRIKSISVFKDQSALDLFGEKGKNGVIKITSKSKEELEDMKEVTVIGYGTQQKDLTIQKDTSPIFYVDGKTVSSDEMEKLKPNDIESINVLKDDAAIKKYGEKGKNGVVEITMKKPIT